MVVVGPLAIFGPEASGGLEASSERPLRVPRAPSAVSFRRVSPSVTSRSTWGAPLSVADSPASRAWPRCSPTTFFRCSTSARPRATNTLRKDGAESRMYIASPSGP